MARVAILYQKHRTQFLVFNTQLLEFCNENENDDFCISNDEFCISNDDCIISAEPAAEFETKIMMSDQMIEMLCEWLMVRTNAEFEKFKKRQIVYQKRGTFCI